MDATGWTYLRHTPSMKNFFRLVRFAWPYRIRFGLSLACAVMVALMGFSTISAVYPLLQILFYHQNCQQWITDKIAETDTAILECRARVEEIEAVRKITVGHADPEARKAVLWTRYLKAVEEAGQKEALVHKAELDQDDHRRARTSDKLRDLRAEVAVCNTRLAELHTALNLARLGDLHGLDQRLSTASHALDSQLKDMRRLRWIEPFITRYLPSDGFRTLCLLLSLVMAGIAVKGVFQFSQDVLVATITQLSLFDLRNLFFRRTMKLDLASFSDQGSAELMARFTNDIDSVSQGFNTLLSKMVREPLRIITFLAGAFWLNWRLTCLTLIIVPISALATYRVGKTLKRAVRRSLESMSNIYKILQESFQGIKLVKAYTMERHERRRFFLETKSLFRKSVRVAKIDALSDPVLEMLALTTVAIALLSGSYLVLNGTTFLDLGLFRIQLAGRPMMIEDLLTLYAMLAGMADPIRKMANVHSKIQRASAASDRICFLMDREPQVREASPPVRLDRHHRTVEFDQVWFAYDGREPVLRGVDLSVRLGETIAIVGPNGCGKSTLLSLLPRFFDVSSGSVRIDGVDVRAVSTRSLRDQIAIVSQETILFEGTIGENIAYGARFASQKQVEEAAERAYAHQFISRMPQGYDTVLTERGMSLSGGQRQRIALARAMLRDPAILILDEATSAVDIQDEALIRRAIETFSRDRTTFIITHGLSALQSADRIVLMNAGRVEAVGTDSELRRSSPLYRRLHDIHFQRESA